MRRASIALCCLAAAGCFPDWDLLDPSNASGTGTGAGGVDPTGGGGVGGTGGSGGTASGTGGTAAGIGGSEGGGGMRPLGPWSTPQVVPELSHPEDDDDPSITADGLELFFNSNRNGGTQDDIWVSKRATRNDAWGTPVLVAELSSVEGDTNHTVSPDGLTMWFKSNRDAPSMPYEVFIATRPDRDSAWSTPVIETNLEAQDMSDIGGVTSDGLTMMGHLTISGVAQELVQLVRGDVTMPWGAAVPVDALNSNTGDSECWLHPDGTVVFFGSGRNGTLGATDLWSSTRASLDDSWDAPINETILNTAENDADPTLTPDLRLIFFSRPVSGGEREIFFSTR